MPHKRTNALGGGGAALTIAPWEHPVVWEFVGKGRYLQAAFCRSAAQLYSAKFGSITLRSLSNLAAEGASSIGLVAWTKEVGCCWDESVFWSGAKGGSVDVLKFLKNNDCPMQTDGMLRRIAGRAGHLEALQFLRRECGCVWDEGFCETAASHGRLEILQYAYESHFECTGSDSPGWDSHKVCMMAAERGHIHILEWAHDTLHEEGLFRAGTSEAAAYGGRLDVLRYLRGIGCEWDVSTCVAAIRNGHVDVLMWAIDEGCPWAVNDKDSFGLSALHRARRVEMIDFLISRGADINALYNMGGRTPLHMRVLQDELDAVKTLVRLGADVNIADRDGRTPLALAIDESHHEIAEVLREAGAREE